MLGAAWRRSRMAEIPEHIGPLPRFCLLSAKAEWSGVQGEDQRLERIVALK